MCTMVLLSRCLQLRKFYNDLLKCDSLMLLMFLLLAGVKIYFIYVVCFLSVSLGFFLPD